MRDSGIRVLVGLYPTSKSRAAAQRRRLKVLDTSEAVRSADVIFLALPDTKIPEVYEREIAPSLSTRPDPAFCARLCRLLSDNHPAEKMSM